MTDSQTPAPKADADKQTPPWGDEENFDADRAWTLIQSLRADKESLTIAKTEAIADRDAAIAERDQAITDRDAAQAQVAEREQDANAARKDLWVERAVRKHGVSDDLIEFLTGDDEDAINAKAERLAGLGKTSKDAAADKADKKDDPAPKKDADVTTRPEPALTPGHGGDNPTVFDPDAIVAAIR